MRNFLLRRKEDISGVSGTGVVAEGVEFDNGKIAMCWLGTFHTVEVADNIHTIEEIHGHKGTTTVEWLSED